MPEELSLWNDTPTRQAILDFVARITTPGRRDFVPPAERIATFDNDGTLQLEKPLYIHRATGRRPIMSAGNSNGDMAMLKYAGGHTGLTLGLLVHPDDPEREYAYDEGAEKALQLAPKEGWIVVSMKNDWKTVFPSSPA